MTNKIVTIVGARPQFVKCSALRSAIGKEESIEEVLVHTGQHYDFIMSNVFFDQLGIRAPEYYLGINGRLPGAMTGEMISEIEGVLVKERPDAVLVYGDTNSTLAGALAAAKSHIPIVHVEAGLRSFNKRMPEELNRVLTDHMSDVLFCPTTDSVRNLQMEGIVAGVNVVGDIMYDVTCSVRPMIEPSRASQRYGVKGRDLAVCTIHRAENTATAQRLQKVIDFVRGYASKYKIVLPMHPGTRSKIEEFGIDMRDLSVIEPLPYLENQELLAASSLIFTDSGGMQKEAYFHRVKCITLRDETEWNETVQSGWNVLWTDLERKPLREIIEYGDGNSAKLIVEHLKSYFS